MTFDEFMASGLRNHWLKEDNGNLSVYVRRSRRTMTSEDGMYIPDPPYFDAIDVASVVAQNRGTGSLTRFLDRIEATNHVFVENVFDDRLRSFLTRRGYRVYLAYQEPKSYLKLKEGEL